MKVHPYNVISCRCTKESRREIKNNTVSISIKFLIVRPITLIVRNYKLSWEERMLVYLNNGNPATLPKESIES